MLTSGYIWVRTHTHSHTSIILTNKLLNMTNVTFRSFNKTYLWSKSVSFYRRICCQILSKASTGWPRQPRSPRKPVTWTSDPAGRGVDEPHPRVQNWTKEEKWKLTLDRTTSRVMFWGGALGTAEISTKTPVTSSGSGPRHKSIKNWWLGI